MIRYLLIGLCLGFLLEAGAQNRSIEFRDGNWEKILKMAKKEKKMVFVDCYTSWCGPCKMLAKNVFTQDSVADFYNKHFVCVKIDMEKGEGVQLAKQYEVGAYPTLLYIDATGKQIHGVTGYMQPSELIRSGEKALSGKGTLADLRQRYEAGEREEEFVKEYMEVLFKVCRTKLQKEVATEYVSGLDAKRFYTRETWNIIVKNLSDPLSPILKKVMGTKYYFCNFISRDTVDLFLDYTLKSAVSGFVWQDMKKSNFNKERYDELLAYLFTVDLPRVPQYVATMYAVGKVAEGDIRGMLDEMHRSLGYGIFYDFQSKLNFIQGFMRKIEVCEDEALVKEADAWIASLIDSSKNGYEKSEYMKVRARLLRVLGEVEKAEEMEAEAPKVRMQN